MALLGYRLTLHVYSTYDLPVHCEVQFRVAKFYPFRSPQKWPPAEIKEGIGSFREETPPREMV